jgi:hypothetical protein
MYDSDFSNNDADINMMARIVIDDARPLHRTLKPAKRLYLLLVKKVKRIFSSGKFSHYLSFVRSLVHPKWAHFWNGPRFMHL